jgi:tRNA threonylcarbamoyladenosine biosynthesis protein TsaE
MHILPIYFEQDVSQIAATLSSVLNKVQIMTFTGQLGAGKTTLIKEILSQRGVKEVVTSPTFTYVNRYENAQGQFFYHFDLYRLVCLDDFLEFGFDEYIYQPNSWAFIEWPEIIMPLLTRRVCHIYLDYAKTPQGIGRSLTYTIIP